MSENREIAKDVAYTAYINVVWNGAAVTGLLSTNFTVTLTFNGNPSGITPTFTDESESGRYSWTFIPNAVGRWILTVISNDDYFAPTGKIGDYLCNEIESNVTSIYQKLPTNNIMGSSVKTDKDDDIDAILIDTDEMQQKLPTNNIMGSSVKSDKDTVIDSILEDTGTTIPNLITSVHATTDALITVVDGVVDAIKLKTDDLPDDLSLEFAKMQGILGKNFYIDSVVRDDQNNITQYRIRVYSDSVSVGTDSNVILTLTIDGTFDSITGFLTILQGVGS